MSLYNMINGYNPACLLILPMLGRKEEEYPRFRDCFVTEDKNIAIYTRVGGGNRNCGFGEEKLYEDVNFLRTYDDEDVTYGTYEFKVPDKWKSDFDYILSGCLSDVSEEYQSYLKSFYPQVAESGLFDLIFNKTSSKETD